MIRKYKKLSGASWFLENEIQLENQRNSLPKDSYIFGVFDFPKRAVWNEVHSGVQSCKEYKIINFSLLFQRWCGKYGRLCIVRIYFHHFKSLA